MEGADDTLRQQFQALQQQQQQKLQRRKQRQEESRRKEEGEAEAKGEAGTKRKGKKAAASEGGDLGALALNDDLDLKLSEPVPNDKLYDDELTSRLNGQIRELKDETGRLYKLLSERDYEIRKLKKQREADRLALGGGGVASDSAATRIVELSKKNRELTAELESDKTKMKQLMRRLKETEKELAASALQQSLNGENGGKGRQRSAFISQEQSEDKAAQLAAELKTQQEALAKSQAKQTDYRNQVNVLKQELKMAQKMLSSEVGENVSLLSLKSEGGGWRGRAQQILLLQNKVAELTRQLDQFKSRPGTEMSLEEQFMTMDTTDDLSSMTSALPRSSKGGGAGSMDERQRQRIRQQEKGRREIKEKAAQELKSLEEDHGKLKEKLDASKARNKVLANELKTSKQQLATLVDKGKHDNELIEALLGQQSQLKKHVEQSGKRQEEVQKQQDKASQDLQLRSQQDANTLEHLRRVVREKEAKLQEMEEALRETRAAAAAALQEQQECRFQLNGYDDAGGHLVRPESRPPTVGAADRPPTADRHSGTFILSPAPPQSRQGVRPPSGQRSSSMLSNGEGSGRLSSRGIRPASTGSLASAESTEEGRRVLQQYKSLCQVAEVERDKLMELVQILQARVDEANEVTTETQGSLQEMKLRNVWLEKQLGKARVEGGSGGAKGSKKGSSALPAVKGPAGAYLTDDDLVSGELALSQQLLQELQTRLAIKIDENDALKSAVKSTLKAKEEDLKLYHEMMRQTKEVFLQGLRQFRQTTGLAS